MVKLLPEVYFAENACQKIIQNALVVFQNVFPHPDCLRHRPKWQYVGSKNNGPITGEIVARSVFCRKCLPEIYPKCIGSVS